MATSVRAPQELWGIGKKGGALFRWNERSGNWEKQDRTPALAKIWVTGSPLLVVGLDAQGTMYMHRGGSPQWFVVPGQFSTAAVTTDGEIWATNAMGAIFCQPPASRRWERVDGSAVELAVGTRDSVISVAHNGRVYSFDGMGWTDLLCPAHALHGAVSENGRVWVTTADNRVLSFTPRSNVWQEPAPAIVPL